MSKKPPKSIPVSLTGSQLLRNPLLNKGMAFPLAERKAFELLGLLPPQVSTLEVQCLRSHEAFLSKPTDLQRYIYLRDLQDSNETLFYALLAKHLEEMLPVVYTPTVGEGAEQFSHIYRYPRGLYLSYEYKNMIDDILAHPRYDSAKIIVVSDGERILGLGDQGAGGMSIPIGKLALYTACAGIDPSRTLPILLDTGTNNPALLNDSLYIGWHHTRITGQDYDDFIETFINSLKIRFKWILLQWEDFAQHNATRLLTRYRQKICSFNDDIQGTASVTLGSLLAALQSIRRRLIDQHILIVGAGSAGIGVANLILIVMIQEGATEQTALDHIHLVDRLGLLIKGQPTLQPFQSKFAKTSQQIAQWKRDLSNITIEFAEAVSLIKPSVLIGVSGQSNIFTEEIIKTMAQHTDRPIIFPLSNPTAYAEAHPQDILRWTEERAIISTGSPFGELVKAGQPFRADQTNNAYIFPGLGLGVLASQAKTISDTMFIVAAKILSEASPAKQNPDANLLPPITALPQISYKIAIAIAQVAIQEGLSPLTSDQDIEARIQAYIWEPVYKPYRRR